jgi:hypothetical protein
MLEECRFWVKRHRKSLLGQFENLESVLNFLLMHLV